MTTDQEIQNIKQDVAKILERVSVVERQAKQEKQPSKVVQNPNNGKFMDFERGKTYEITSTIKLPGGYSARAVGDPSLPKPVLVAKTTKAPVFYLGEDDSAVCDVTIKTPNQLSGKCGIDGIQVGPCRGTKIINVDTPEKCIDTAINLNGRPVDVTVDNCSFVWPISYGVWSEGQDVKILNSKFTGSVLEHPLRSGFSGTSYLTINHCDFYNNNKTSINIQKGDNATITNTKVDGVFMIGPLALGADTINDRFETVKVDSCEIVGGIIVNHGANNVTIQNSKITCNNEKSVTGKAISIQGYNEQHKRGNSNINISNVEIYNNETMGAAIEIWGRVEGLSVSGVIYKATNIKQGAYGTSGMNIHVDQGENWNISNNSWPLSHDGSYPKGAVCIVKDRGLNSQEWNNLPFVNGDKFVG